MKKTKKQIKTNKKFTILISILFVILTVTIVINLIQDLNKPVYSQEIPVYFAVAEKMGLVINTSVLDFGITYPFAPVDKKINLTNEFEYPVILKVVIDPKLDNYLFGATDIEIPAGETITYGVSLIPAKDAEYGNYSGYIRFDFSPLK